MNFSKIFIYFACFVCFTTPVFAQSSGKIGFVDLKKVFRDYKKVSVMEEKIRQETEVEVAKIKSLNEEAKQLKEEIPLYKAGSKLRENKEKRLTDLAFEVKYLEAKSNHYLSERLKKSLENVYREVSVEIEKYAQMNNYFIILSVSEPDFMGNQTAEALRAQIITRNVLYWEKKNDITNLIIQRLNEAYEKEKKGF